LKLEETLQLAAETAGVGTWNLFVLEDRLHSSPKCKEIFGLSPDHPFQMEDFLELVLPEDRPLVKALVASALDPNGLGRYEVDYRITHPDGSVRWIGGKGKAFFDDRDGVRIATRFIGTVLDHTERKKIQDALVESEKLAVMGRLAASIAHEIRNPVDAVLNLLFLLRTEPEGAKRDEYIRQAESELGRVSAIATNTLRFYRDPAGVTVSDLGEVVQTVLDLFSARLASSHAEVETRIDAATFVSAPQGEVRQVIANLVSNALDAMPRGGRLILRGRSVVNRKTDRRCVRLTVADSGVGMTADAVSRIFEAFYTTKGAAGNGLGLWLSLEILKKCGSCIRVKSAVGRGTVFQLSFPVP